MLARVHKVIWSNFLYAALHMWLWWVCSNCCLIYGFVNANVMHALCDFLALIPNWSIPIDPLLEVARTPRLIHTVGGRMKFRSLELILCPNLHE